MVRRTMAFAPEVVGVSTSGRGLAAIESVVGLRIFNCLVSGEGRVDGASILGLPSDNAGDCVAVRWLFLLSAVEALLVILVHAVERDEDEGDLARI